MHQQQLAATVITIGQWAPAIIGGVVVVGLFLLYLWAGIVAHRRARMAEPRRPPPWPVDLVNGVVRGEYTPRLGITGRIAQGTLGFVPGIGQICAVRDFFACSGKHDRVGMALNALALIPGLGGFPKTAEVIRAAREVGHVYVAGHTYVQNRSNRQNGQPTSASSPPQTQPVPPPTAAH